VEEEVAVAGALLALGSGEVRQAATAFLGGRKTQTSRRGLMERTRLKGKKK
jgi:hypothetical protein